MSKMKIVRKTTTNKNYFSYITIVFNAGVTIQRAISPADPHAFREVKNRTADFLLICPSLFELTQQKRSLRQLQDLSSVLTVLKQFLRENLIRDVEKNRNEHEIQHVFLRETLLLTILVVSENRQYHAGKLLKMEKLGKEWKFFLCKEEHVWEQLQFNELLLNLGGNSGQLWGCWWICLDLEELEFPSSVALGAVHVAGECRAEDPIHV